MLLTLTRPSTPSLEMVPDVPPKGPVQQLSYCSLSSPSSTSDESSLSHSTCDTSSEAVICSLVTRPPTPTPPRPPRHAARSHDRRPKTAPPSAIGTSLSRGFCSIEESDGRQPVVVFRRWRVGSKRGFVATRVAPPLHPPPTRPLPYPPAHYIHPRPSSGLLHIDTAQRNHVALQPPMPILPIFPSRDSSSSSSTSNSATSPPAQSSDTTMLAVPLLHPLAANQGSPVKREQPRHSNQSAQFIPPPSPSPHKHRSKFTLPLISGSSHFPLALVPFPDQHTPSLTSPGTSYIPVPSSSTLPPSPFSSPPRSLQCPYATLSSSTLPASNTQTSQDSLSDTSPLTGMHYDPRSTSFRLRGPLGYPLAGFPIAAAVEIHQPSSAVTTRPRPFSMHNKRAKSALRNSQSPHSVGGLI
ncbi:hypothetical protein F5141DRAFT_698325 [Pisolithus sp. B1]|nr:hypothetical protein F5141DRAFT_698325 [Pisolithus sp. B1]